MQAISTQKFVRMSPRKLRLVADMVRGKDVQEVLEFLPFVRKQAAMPIQKVVKSAAANAQVKGANPAELKVQSIEIEKGPYLKRFRPVSRGQAHSYVRKMSHIKVVLTDENSKVPVELRHGAGKAQKSKRQTKTKYEKTNKKALNAKAGASQGKKGSKK